MFWGCIIGGKKGVLVLLWPDQSRTRKKGVTAEIILGAYKEHLPCLFRRHIDCVFMQDNARAYIAKVTMD